MLPVSSSEPAMITRIRPRAKTVPAKNVLRPPQIAGSSPDETTMASRPAKAMYAPARKPATTAFCGDSLDFLMPVSVPALAIAIGSLNAMAPRLPGLRPDPAWAHEQQHPSTQGGAPCQP